ncbi:MAG: hypothetical protein JNK74_03680 [Candidatus Hydrogenedentes bacterium]|nr:hypothetical protein [Candidatus Hydrogenedentota bacterium]
MSLIDTKDFIKAGQKKTHSFWEMFWLTRFKGYHVANTLHVPHRNMFGRLGTSKVWIVDRTNAKQ